MNNIDKIILGAGLFIIALSVFKLNKNSSDTPDDSTNSPDTDPVADPSINTGASPANGWTFGNNGWSVNSEYLSAASGKIAREGGRCYNRINGKAVMGTVGANGRCITDAQTTSRMGF